ncbi:MAG: amidohydrolase [Candidatus Thorarchaeota archaeon]|nr:amidohydrolase [Candidatus Thorarchaeota archaeon]
MSQNSVLIKHGYLITMNERREIVTDGAVYVEGSRVVEVSKTDEMKHRAADKVIDASGRIVMPGLIDTHVHLAQALIRGCADDVSLVDWLKKYVWVLQGNFTRADGRVSAELCMAEMIKTGTTSFIECMTHSRYGFDGIAEAVKQVGMRAALSKIVMDSTGYADSRDIMYPGMVEEAEECLRETDEMFHKWHGRAEGRLQVWYGLRSLGAVTPGLFRRVVQLTRDRGTRMTMHLGEVVDDVRYVKANGYRDLTSFASEMGLLGSDMVFAHGIHFDDEELRVLAQTQTNISHCPSSNAKLASGFAKVPRMIEAGVPVSLGCDGGPSNNTYDLLREMRLCALVHKPVQHNPLVVTAEQALEMATLGGARAMGLAGMTGSIAPGMCADIIVVSQDHVGLNPILNPVSNLVYAGSGRDVETVMVNGRLLMEERRLLTVDETSLIRRANEHASRLIERAGVEVRPKWPVR